MKFKSDIEVQAGLRDGSNDTGTAGQLLSSTGTITNWIDQEDLVGGGATRVLIACKNTSGATITKGTPVYQTGNVGATDVIEVAEADALISTGYLPAIGLLETDLINNAFGHVVITGELLNITTDPIDGLTPTTGDTIYLKSGGGLTLTKPTGEGNAIQNLGLVGKVSGGNAGSLTVASIMRQNDVPNLPTGRIWVGDGNTIVSDVVYLDETNGRMGIGTTSPSEKLEVNGGNLIVNDGTSKSRLRPNDLYMQQSGVIKAWLRADGNSYLNGGNVGIGTTSPGSKLSISGASSNQFEIINVVNSKSWRPNVNGNDFYITESGVSNPFVIQAGGNVGIGTTSPSQKLHVSGNAIVSGIGVGTTTIYSNSVNLNNSGTLRIGNAEFLAKAGNDLSIYQGKIRIQQGGNVGIGTTSPSAKLDVVASGVGAEITSGQSKALILKGGVNSQNIQEWSTTTNSVLAVVSSVGNVGIGTTSPDGLLHIDGISDSKSGLVLEASNNGDNRSIDFQNTSAALRLGIEYDNVNINLNVVDRNRDKLLTVRESGNVGIGTTTPSEKLEVNGTVIATATTDAYKGYIKQTITSIANEKASSADYLLVPMGGTITTVSSDQYYNRTVAAYDGRIKKVYIRNTGGSTPDASAVNLKRQVNNTTASTVYSATVANSASAGMSAVYNFADSDFTFNEGDTFGILYQTTNSGGGSRSMGGVAVNIIIEYNIT